MPAMSFISRLPRSQRHHSQALQVMLDTMRALMRDPEALTQFSGNIGRVFGTQSGPALLHALAEFCTALEFGARRRVRCAPQGSPRLTCDERCVLQFLTCVQAGHEEECAIRCQSLMAPSWQKQALATAQDVSRVLMRANVRVPKDTTATPVPDTPLAMDHPSLMAV